MGLIALVLGASLLVVAFLLELRKLRLVNGALNSLGLAHQRTFRFGYKSYSMALFTSGCLLLVSGMVAETFEIQAPQILREWDRFIEKVGLVGLLPVAISVCAGSLFYIAGSLMETYGKEDLKWLTVIVCWIGSLPALSLLSWLLLKLIER